MTYLRSGHAHNLHYDPFSLITFARTQAGQPLAEFLEPYGRPSLALFRAHSQQLIQQYKLNSVRLMGRASGLSRIPGGWRVETETGSIESARGVDRVSTGGIGARSDRAARLADRLCRDARCARGTAYLRSGL